MWNHGGMIERDNDFLWFKTKARFGFRHRLLLKLWRVRGKRNKKEIFGIIFFFFKFSSFWKFGNRFWYQLKQMFLINYQYFQRYATLKHAVKMPLHQWYCLIYIHGGIKFCCSKWEDPGLYWPKKVLIYVSLACFY